MKDQLLNEIEECKKAILTLSSIHPEVATGWTRQIRWNNLSELKKSAESLQCEVHGVLVNNLDYPRMLYWFDVEIGDCKINVDTTVKVNIEEVAA